MEFKPVQSSSIKALHYDKEQHKLTIEFKQGKHYQYSDVPEYMYIRLIQAKSIGKFFNDNIKLKYPFSEFFLPEIKKDELNQQ